MKHPMDQLPDLPSHVRRIVTFTDRKTGVSHSFEASGRVYYNMLNDAAMKTDRGLRDLSVWIDGAVPTKLDEL